VTVTATPTATTATVTGTAAAQPATTVTVTAAPPPPAAGTTIEDGTWTVGVDITPGTYRLSAPVTSGMCYWGIYRSGSNQQAIVNNGIETGGRPTVTLKGGQDFSSKQCGTWARVG
jgi:hypothetical protein